MMETNFKQAVQLATEAYLRVWREQGIKFCPPVGDNTRDKHWARRLREAWPECTTVEIPKIRSPDAPGHMDMMTWAKQQPSSFWVSGGQNVWYFERRDIAVLFKLTFGGAQ